MQKYISAKLIETTATHYFVELTVETKKLFGKPTQSKVNVFREKRFSAWRYLSTGKWMSVDDISYSLNAFISTGKQEIIF